MYPTANFCTGLSTAEVSQPDVRIVMKLCTLSVKKWILESGNMDLS